MRIGLLGRGTVGAAFAELLAERAEAVEAATGRRPEIAGVLTRSEGDFGEILERSDLIVELMGGTDPAREYVIDAMRAGRPVVTANKQLLAQHGDELFGIARESGVQLRFEAAVAAVIPIVRTIQEGFGAPRSRRSSGSSTAPPTSSSARWRRAGRATRRCWRGRRSSATPRPTRPTTSAAPTRRRRWRSSRGSPSTLR